MGGSEATGASTKKHCSATRKDCRMTTLYWGATHRMNVRLLFLNRRLPGSGGVGGPGGAAILSSPGRQGVSYPYQGTNVVEKVQYHPPAGEAPGYVTINDKQRFAGVDPQTWEMQIGGYQPLEKWLKDRKGRKLATEDVQHYLRVIIALRETRRIMAEIDSIIPAWPLP